MTVTITEPVPRDLQSLLRTAVLEHVRGERRRSRFPPVLHVGTPGAEVVELRLDPDDHTDHALRTDVLGAMLRRAGRLPGGGAPLVWLVRPGALEPTDADLDWRRAAAAAGAELEVAVPLVVVVRHGWRDPWSGVGRAWVRLRDRRRGSATG